ncbi:hypothetical protein [Komagataeibacter medellinensis]|nr:hypothetical protein [Komagataeibacter medellinensis]
MPCSDPAPRSHAMVLALLCLAVPGLMAATAHAAGTPSYPTPLTDAHSTAHAWGIETRIASTTPCQVEMTVNQTIFMAHVPEMVQAGLLNTLVTPALQKQAPHYLMNTVQTDVTPGFVHALFTQNGAPARCHFAWSYIAPDGLPHSMLGFDFTRAAHDHIDWDHLRFGDMVPTAQNTVVDPQFDTLVNQETVDVTIALARDHAPGDLPPPGQAAGARP